MCMSPAKHPRGPTFIKPVSGCSSILLRSKKITLVALKPVHRSCRLCTSGKGGAKACHTESLNIQAHQPKRVFSTFMSDRDFHREGRKMRVQQQWTWMEALTGLRPLLALASFKQRPCGSKWSACMPRATLYLPPLHHRAVHRHCMAMGMLKKRNGCLPAQQNLLAAAW